MKRLQLSTAERECGLIVCAREQQTGETLSLHRAGAPKKALLEIVEILDRLGPEWLVCSVSSPHSIYRDLQGTRTDIDNATFHGGKAVLADDPRSTERATLSGIRRLDLLEPLRREHHLHSSIVCTIPDRTYNVDGIRVRSAT